jgi:hypothetical protein
MKAQDLVPGDYQIDEYLKKRKYKYIFRINFKTP